MSAELSTLVTPDTARYDVAAAIRAHAAVRRLSDSALGREIGMTQSKISRRMNGEIAFDTNDLGRLATYFGMSVVELIQMPTSADPVTRGGGAGIRTLRFVEPASPGVEDRRFTEDWVAPVIPIGAAS